jgi:hypothetical protein
MPRSRGTRRLQHAAGSSIIVIAGAEVREVEGLDLGAALASGEVWYI